MIRFERLAGLMMTVYWKRRQLEQVQQQIRRMTPEQFGEWMNEQLTKSYQLAEQHWREAAEIEPKRPSVDYVKRLEARAKKIRTEWDNIQEVTVEDGNSDTASG